jgi:hypothetical protein
MPQSRPVTRVGRPDWLNKSGKGVLEPDLPKIKLAVSLSSHEGTRRGETTLWAEHDSQRGGINEFTRSRTAAGTSIPRTEERDALERASLEQMAWVV